MLSASAFAPDARFSRSNKFRRFCRYNFDSHTAERYACTNATACAAGPHAMRAPASVAQINSGASADSIGSGTPFAWNEGDVETACVCAWGCVPTWLRSSSRGHEKSSTRSLLFHPLASKPYFGQRGYPAC